LQFSFLHQKKQWRGKKQRKIILDSGIALFKRTKGFPGARRMEDVGKKSKECRDAVGLVLFLF